MKSYRTSIVTLAAMSLLILSGISVPSAALAAKPTAGGVTHVFPAAPPTFVGNSNSFLLGPNLVTSQFGTTAGTTASPNGHYQPSTLADKLNPPSVNCPGTGCFAISGTSSATTNLLAMNSVGSSPFTVEPPDQGMCVGNGYVVEAVNQGEVQVYSASTLKSVSGVVPLDSLMGLTTLGWSSGGDPMCVYDSANGGHFFITEIVSASSESAGGPFGGCFAGVPDTCFEGIAVSVTNNPTGAYYVYFLAADKVNSDPGSDATPDGLGLTGVLLNDFAKTALTRDGFLLFYDEFDLYTGALNGAQEFAFAKTAMEKGSAAVNAAYEDMGTAPNLSTIPSNGVYQPFNLPGTDWYEAIPAQTSDPTQYDNSNGGTGYMIATLDYFGAGDNRTAVFDWNYLTTLNSAGCSGCGSITFGGAIVTGTVTYQDEGGACLASQYLTFSTFCGLASQKAGPTPLGDSCASLGDGEPSPCPENGLATNGDGATQAFYSQGVIWTAVSTIVSQSFSGGSEFHVGATYWGISTSHHAGSTNFGIANQGYVSASHEDISFPAMAATGGAVLMSFTLTGDGGPSGADGGGFYPSSAYLMLSSPGASIHIAALGQSPQDGFSEYQYYGTSLSFLFRPRWGDYGQAVFDSATGKFFFASEYIQSPNCGDTAYSADSTCGGTRVTFANWGTSINSISA
jgi:hypothetical protein